MRVSAGDIQLNYEEAGEGTALVLTHGLGSDLHYWDHVFEACAAHHRAIRWDVRGFGASDKPAGPYTPAMLAADLAHLLDRLGVQRAHLAGISMGGVIAQRFALDHAPRVLSLVLSSTSSEVGTQATANWQRLADRVERDGFDARSADASRSFSSAFAARCPEVVAAVGRQTLANDPHAYAAAARAMSDYRWTDALGQLDRPVLLLQGLDDQLTPPGGAVKMRRALPRACLLMIPTAGHNLPLEQPLTFQNSALAFTAAVDMLTAA